MKTKLFLSLLLITISFATCKKGDTGPQGPDGPQGPTGATGATGISSANLQGGFIEGTIIGTRADGTPFTLDFNYQYYWEEDTYLPYSFYDLFDMIRYPAEDRRTQGSCELNFALSSLTSNIASNPKYFTGKFYKDLGNNQTMYLEVNATSNASTIFISNLSYDTNTHIMTGDFNIDVYDFENSTNHQANIAGTFKSVGIKEYVLRKG